MDSKKVHKAVTVSDMDRILTNDSRVALKKDINAIKKVYLDYVKFKLAEINEDFPQEVGRNFIDTIQEKYEDSNVKFDFNRLLDKMMDKTIDVLEENFKVLKREIIKL